MSTERVLVALDISNLWYSCRELFGYQSRISYPDLVNLIKKPRYRGNLRLVDVMAYAIAVPGRSIDLAGNTTLQPPKNQKFLDHLASLGFTVKIRRMKTAKGVDKPFHTDWDIGITIDAINKMDFYDTFTLVSGDGDFCILLEELKTKNKRIEVVTFEQSLSHLLYEIADSITYISSNEVFVDHRNK